MDTSTTKVLVLSAGGHSRVLIDALVRTGRFIVVGITDPAFRDLPPSVGGVAVLGDDSSVEAFDAGEVKLVNGIGSVRVPELRKTLFERFKQQGYRFQTVVHPSAIIAADVVLGEGAQVMAGVVVQTGSVIGDDVILNTSSSIDHDARIGAHTHVAPGVTLSGNVTLGEAVHVGTGAVVIQGITVGNGSLIAAGAVVVRDVAAHTRVAGVPAVARTP